MLGHADSLAVHEGTLIAKQSITRGIDNAVDGLLGMLKGENFGKAVLTIADLEEKVSIDCMPYQNQQILTSTVRCGEVRPKTLR